MISIGLVSEGLDEIFGGIDFVLEVISVVDGVGEVVGEIESLLFIGIDVSVNAIDLVLKSVDGVIGSLDG